MRKLLVGGVSALLCISLLGTAHAAAAPMQLSLEESVQMALAKHYDLSYAKEAREKSYWSLKEAKNNKGLAASFTHTDTVAQSVNSFQNKVALTLPIYSGGSLEGKIKQAEEALRVADLDVNAAQQQVKLNVVSNYLSVLEYQKIWQVSQDTTKNYEDHLKLVENKYAAGMVAKLDVLTSQVDLAKAQDSQVQAENNYRNAVAALNNELQLPHGTELELKDAFNSEGYPLSLEECVAYAKEHRPEIAQYKAKMNSAKEGIDVARSGYRPTVNLSASQGWNDEDFPGSKNSNWSVSLTTSLNLFDSGVTGAQVEQAKHNLNMVNEQKGKEEDSVLLEVRQYYLSMQEAAKRIETNKVAIQQAEESLSIQKMRYEVGVGTNLDLRESVLSLDQAKRDSLQALYDYNINKAKLEHSMGRPVE